MFDGSTNGWAGQTFFVDLEKEIKLARFEIRRAKCIIHEVFYSVVFVHLVKAVSDSS
jgi:hypothetical protein